MLLPVKFGNYSKAEREEMVKKGWAIADKDSGGAFPIANKSDLGDALHRIGTTNHPRAMVVNHIRKRARELGATDMLGDKTTPPKAKSGATAIAGWNDAVKFTSRRVAPNGMIIRRGKVYEAGPRLDMHGISFNTSEQDLAQMVLNFQPFPIGSGHPEAPSPLDGHLGQVTSLFLGESPTDLWAEAEVPPFVDEVLGDADARVSMVFDRYTKQPLGLDFVNDPNVVDAVLMASFARARHDTPSGQAAMQSIHDMSAKSGAVCQRKSQNASRHESSAIQQVHDISAEHGAKCEGAMASFARRHNVVIDWTKFWGGLIHAANEEPETAAFATGDPNDFEANWQEQQVGGMGAGATADCDASCCGGDDDGDEDDVCSCGDCPRCGMTTSGNDVEGTEANPMAGTSAHAAAPAAAATASRPRIDPATAELEAERARNRQLEADLQRERAHRIESEAVAFAESEIQAQRSLPAEQEILMELFRQAAADDMVLGTIKLANGHLASRTERLKALFAGRSEHWMTKELLATSLSPEVMMNALRTAQATEPQPMDADQKKAYMNMTEKGRAALAANQARN